MMTDIKELEERYDDARRARYKAERDKDREHGGLMAEAKHRIDAEMAQKHSAGIAPLIKAEIEARRILEAAKVDVGNAKLASYPSGIVVEYKVPRAKWSGRTLGDAKPTGRRGRYEVRTAETVFAANIPGDSFRLPTIGSVFIRFLKKDGTPRSGFAIARGGFGDWRPEGDQAEPVKEPEPAP